MMTQLVKQGDVYFAKVMLLFADGVVLRITGNGCKVWISAVLALCYSRYTAMN